MLVKFLAHLDIWLWLLNLAWVTIAMAATIAHTKAGKKIKSNDNMAVDEGNHRHNDDEDNAVLSRLRRCQLKSLFLSIFSFLYISFLLRFFYFFCGYSTRLGFVGRESSIMKETFMRKLLVNCAPKASPFPQPLRN